MLLAELAQFTSDDPNFEQLTAGLPYLDAVVCESLCLHPITSSSTREANLSFTCMTAADSPLW